MTTTLPIEEILDRGRRERERTAYPEGFPVLPPVPARRYADAGFAALEREHVFDTELAVRRPRRRVGRTGRLPPAAPAAETGPARARSRRHDPRHAQLLPTSRRSGRARRRRQHRAAAGLRLPRLDLRPRRRRSSASPERRTSKSTRACLGLPPVRCEAWGSLVFVNLDSDAPPLLDALGVVGRELHDQIGGGDGVGPVHLVGRRSIEVDGQLEAHGRRQHRDLPRQHGPPDQRRRRPRPGGDRHLPLPRRTFPDARAQPRRRGVPDRPARLPGRQPAGELRDLLVPPVPQHEHRVRRIAGARLPDLELAARAGPQPLRRPLPRRHARRRTARPAPRRAGRSQLGGAARRPRQPRRHPALRRERRTRRR